MAGYFDIFNKRRSGPSDLLTYEMQGSQPQGALQSLIRKYKEGLNKRGAEMAQDPAGYLSQAAMEGLPPMPSAEPGRNENVSKWLSDNVGFGAMATVGRAGGKASHKVAKSKMTVTDPERNALFPGVYDDPRIIVERARDIARQTPESESLFKVFGVTRDDLYQQSLGLKSDNPLWVPPMETASGKGAAAARKVMGPKNTQRLVDILGEARNTPELEKGMVGWYNLNPAYNRLQQITDDADQKFTNFNHFTGMSSPNAAVASEIPRGTAANWLYTQGRFDDYAKHGGKNDYKKQTDPTVPEDMREIPGHMAHSTAHVKPMQNWLAGNPLNAAKVPSYIAASQPPGLGLQTNYAVGDAHWSRAVGLPDVRGSAAKDKAMRDPVLAGGDPKKYKEYMSSLAASASPTEMKTLAPWWRDKVAGAVGLDGVPGQAVTWGAGAASTGVKTGIGVPKLEIIADQIVKAAKRQGVPIEVMRDRVLLGQGWAGNASPEMMALLAGASGAGLAAMAAGKGKKDPKQPPPGQQEALMRLMQQQGMY